MLLLISSILGCVLISDDDLAERLAWGATDDSGEPCTTAWWYPDSDGDGYGDPLGGMELCEGASGTVTNDADCDDTDPALSPQTIWFYDGDGDGFGDPDITYVSCEEPEGYSSDATDCFDFDASIFPGADEICDGVDSDCDDEIDEDPIDPEVFFADTDSDGYGDADSTIEACTAPSGFVVLSGDCDDSTDTVAPDLEEVCGDGLDNNCDDSINDCALSGAYGLDEADGVLWGEARRDAAGLSMDAQGDLTGDGVTDLVVAAPFADNASSDSGSVYLVSGLITGQGSLASATARIDGAASGDRLGVVAASSDIDGDGFSDLLLSTSTVDAGLGRAYVLSGPITGAVSVSSAIGTVDGATSDDRLGTTLAAPGDTSGDGLADLMVGAYGDDTSGNSAGAVFLFLGPATGEYALTDAHASFYGEAVSDRAGVTVSAAGDVDGDGLADLLIGADRNGSANAGAAYLVLGGASGSMSLADADWILRGESDGEEAGMGLGAAGDVNGDGLDDLLIGGGGGGTPGIVWLVSGAGLGSDTLADAQARIDGGMTKTFADGIGSALAGAGDVDGDGQADLLIGGETSDGTGAAWLLYGPVSGGLTLSSADVTWTGSSGDLAGYSLAAPGDINSDGLSDLLIAAPYADSPDTNAGTIYLILGAGL
ncbi:MAG: FG-GAP-like repeat-containing protein [Myxococcota bacterium]|nr:FG-GAP-like repeat-containing protein [Myxococcota bacterium]